jgi:excisionase family DNA binding protein
MRTVLGDVPTQSQLPTTATAALGASMLSEVMTAAETAAILQMRVSTVEDYARRGILPSLKVGRHRRFIRSQVEQAIANMADR